MTAEQTSLCMLLMQTSAGSMSYSCLHADSALGTPSMQSAYLCYVAAGRYLGNVEASRVSNEHPADDCSQETDGPGDPKPVNTHPVS